MPVNIGINIQRSPNRINQQLREAGVEGKFPKLLLDFQDEYYLANGSSKTLANAVTHARSGNAVMTDGYGSELVFNGTFEDLSDSADRFRNIDDELLRAAISVEPQATEFDVLVDGRKIGDISNNGSVTAFDASQYTGWLLGSLTNQTYIDYIEDVLNPYIDANLSKYTTGYTLGTGWSIADGEARSDGSQSSFSDVVQSISTTSGTTYIGQVTVRDRTAGTLTGFAFDSATLGTTGAQSSDGTYTFVFTAVSASTSIYLRGNVDFVGAIDNVSVREMPVLKWAPHNLLTHSEEFDNAAWSSTGTVTVTANAATAPDGTATADRVVTSGASALTQSVVQQLNHTIEVWVKAVTAGSNNTFRLQGTGGKLSSNLTATGDWQLFSFTPTTLGTNGNWGLNRDSSNNAMDLYVWGAHVYRSDLGGMVDNPERGDSYVPTTTAVKYLPRIGHHVYNGSAWVNEGLLAESESRTNFLTYSDFSGGFGTNRVTKTADQAISPDGNENATEIVETAESGFHYISVNSTVTASVAQTLSCYVKQSSGSRSVIIRTNNQGSTSYIVFDFATESITEIGSAARNETVQDVGNGWYRIAFTYTQSASTLSGYIVSLSNSTTPSTSLPSYTGDGSSGVYIYGGQFEQGETPSSLVPTGSGSSVTRAAETFTIPSANLPWPSPNYTGSELITNGTFDSDISNWTAGGNGTLSHSSGQLVIEDNGYAYQVITTEVGKLYYAEVEVTAVSSSPAGSWELRIGTSEYPPDLFDGPSISTTGKESTTFVATTTSTYIVLKTHGTSGGTQTVTWDNVTVREIDPLSVSIAMDGRMTYADGGNIVENRPYQWFDDADNRIQVYLDTSGANTGRLTFYQEENNVADFIQTGTTALNPDVLVPFNIASRHGSTFINAALDGVDSTANTTPTALADLSATDFELAKIYMGTIGTFRVWDRDIADTGLVEATNPSLEPSLSLTFEGVGSNSFVVNDWSE